MLLLIIFWFEEPAGIHGNTQAEAQGIIPQVALLVAPAAEFDSRIQRYKFVVVIIAQPLQEVSGKPAPTLNPYSGWLLVDCTKSVP